MPFLDDSSLFSILCTRMKWRPQRQGVLAENATNVGVSNHKAKETVEEKFEVPVSLGPQRINQRHMDSGSVLQPDLFTRNPAMHDINPQSGGFICR